jgi:hypothetical protein
VNIDKQATRRSIVFANSHAMTQDERLYKDPKKFNPHRYIPIEEGGAGEPLPLGQFGFGRRYVLNPWIGKSHPGHVGHIMTPRISAHNVQDLCRPISGRQ